MTEYQWGILTLGCVFLGILFITVGMLQEAEKDEKAIQDLKKRPKLDV